MNPRHFSRQEDRVGVHCAAPAIDFDRKRGGAVGRLGTSNVAATKRTELDSLMKPTAALPFTDRLCKIFERNRNVT
jgi:hypothetical protein